MIPVPVPPDLEPMDPTERFIDALNWGEIADAIFAMRCEALGVRPDAVPAGGSPLEYLVTASAPKGLPL